MPFSSYRQQRFMFWKHPKIARRWAHKYGTKKKPKGYRPRNSRKSGVASKTDPVALKAIKRIIGR